MLAIITPNVGYVVPAACFELMDRETRGESHLQLALWRYGLGQLPVMSIGKIAIAGDQVLYAVRIRLNREALYAILVDAFTIMVFKRVPLQRVIAPISFYSPNTIRAAI